jgi:hypothetical protein
MNLTQLERVQTELKWASDKHLKFETYDSLKPMEIVFSKQKSVFYKYAKGLRVS